MSKIKKGFHDFGAVVKNDGDILYSDICEIIESSEELLILAQTVPLGQPFPNVLLGSIHFLLLQRKNI